MSGTLPHLEIRLLGQFQVLQEGRRVAGFDSEKTRAFFALLVFANGDSIEYDTLAADLWGTIEDTDSTDSDQRRSLINRTAQGSLRQCIWRLLSGRPTKKHSLDARLAAERLFKPTGRSRISLDLANAEVDVFRWESVAASASYRDRKKAVDLYTGDLMPDCRLPALALHRLRLQTQHRALLEELIRDAKASGNYADAIRFLHLRIASEPHTEAWREHLMDLLVRCGEENAAKEIYHQYRAGLPPRSFPGPTMQAKMHHLRSLPPRQPTGWSPPEFARILNPLPQILGREQPLAEIVALLDSFRFITLKGPPGVGKTLLAHHVASRLAPTYNDKVLFIDLTDAHTLLDVQYQIAVCFGTFQTRADLQVENIAKQIGLQRVLLVLDNCEQIVGETSAFLMSLLSQAPRISVLATSQCAWRSLIGEQVYHVRPLPLPPTRLLRLSAEALPDALLQYDSITVFVKEVEKIRTFPGISRENAHVIAAIVMRLDGLPLAIKLAAGMSYILTPEEIFRTLERDLNLLRDQLQVMPEKHRTLYVMLHLVYNRLPVDLRTLLRALAMFRGGWTLAAAQKVCTHNQTAEALVQLQERSLIQSDPNAGGMRFSMLETLQRFLSNRVEETSESAEVADRHLHYYTDFAADTERHLTGPTQGYWFQGLGLELENFRAALDWALRSSRIARGLQLATSIWRLWAARGIYYDGYQFLDRLLAEPFTGEPGIRLKALGACGNLAYQSTNYENARLCFEAVREMTRPLKAAATDALSVARYTLAEASALGNLGNIASLQGDHAQAETLLQSAHIMFKNEEEERGIVMVLGNLAANASRAGDFPRAIGYSLQTVERMQELGDPLNLAMAKANLADSLFGNSHIGEALNEVTEAITISSGVSHWRTVGQCHALLLSIAVSQEAWHTAADLIGLRVAMRQSGQMPAVPPVQDIFDMYTPLVETALDTVEFIQALGQVASLEPEQCLLRLQAHCTHLKNSANV